MLMAMVIAFLEYAGAISLKKKSLNFVFIWETYRAAKLAYI